ncbi:ABC transporter ATP-binding protein [Paramicrobacterium chengjingii]|uniref:ABC transporter ATP-binding protein n=1 Tax=Paramicrobacterium chengjingii TaxID=2769067 RepID=A0ABX6YKY8_9MICO|nr:ABC transporter ATP-binding protein [Microbacterium chengjingii]QPZ39395.1 ABC transporter ATP-binding protein [Microbacterium chengjingii]
MKVIVNTLRRILPYLPSGARRFLSWYAVLTSVLAIIDVVALLALAATLAAAVSGASFNLPIIGTIPASATLWVIVIASIIIVTKSALSVWLQWQATRRFAKYELSIGQHLLAAYIRAPWMDRLSRNTSQILQMTDTGIANVVAGFLLPLTTMPGLIVTSVGVLAAIVVSQPVTALVTVVYLGGIAALQYVVLGRKTRQAARVARDSALRVASLVSGMVAALKEITLRDKAREVEDAVGAVRSQTARARANSSFLSTVPRFIFDAAIIGGFVLAGGVAFALGGMDQAISAVALFGIAGFRLIPSLTGFQNIVTRAITAGPYVSAVVNDIEDSREYLANHEQLGKDPLPENPKLLTFRGVEYTYPGGNAPVLTDVNLNIPLGATVGIAGSSGAGKSTLIDLLLGLLLPTRGSIDIDDAELSGVLSDWRRQVGYVPQEVALFDGTIAQNIALTWGEEFDLERVERAAKRAQLWQVVEDREHGLNTRVGERGLALSGGQRQRLGIARALYNDPLVLVLDEATSALDTRTEADVTDAIHALHGDITVIAVAHRLSTIRGSDLLVFMKEGRIQAQGSFAEVVAKDPDFAMQAKLAGLT